MIKLSVRTVLLRWDNPWVFSAYVTSVRPVRKGMERRHRHDSPSLVWDLQGLIWRKRVHSVHD
jgi:hypothetical protein